MGKHMCILPLSYISEAANLLWLPVGKPGVSSHQSSRLLPIRGASSPPSRPWPPCCDTLTQAGGLPAPVTYLLTTVCAASCQPANPGSRRQTVALGAWEQLLFSHPAPAAEAAATGTWERENSSRSPGPTIK